MDNETTPVAETTNTTPGEYAVKLAVNAVAIVIGVLIVARTKDWIDARRNKNVPDFTEE